ncbi:MAG: hypothetical protein DCO96_14515 [Fluviicola sp. XM-24bin1]|nr:MAG: hypothetical protein DCO96_14515 [Fluviicola sp. XM-24bin1]
MKFALTFLIFAVAVTCYGQDSIIVKNEIQENSLYRNEATSVSSTQLRVYYETDPKKETIESQFNSDSTHAIDLTTSGAANVFGEIPMTSEYEHLHITDQDFSIPEDLVLHTRWDGTKSYFDSIQTNVTSAVHRAKLRRLFRFLVNNAYSPEFSIKKGDTAEVERVFSLPLGANGQVEVVCTYYYVLKDIQGNIASFEMFAKGGAGDIRFELFETNFSGSGELKFDIKNRYFALVDFNITAKGKARKGRELADLTIVMQYLQNTEFLGAC